MKRFLSFLLAVFVTASLPAASVGVLWDDNSTNETGFEIHRAVGAAPLDTAFVKIGTVGANVKTYVDAVVVSGVTYSYKIRAYNATDLSAFSNMVTVTLSAPLNAPSGATATQTPLVTVLLSPGDSYTVKASPNPTRPGSKTINIAPNTSLQFLYR